MMRWLAGWSGIVAAGCASALTVTVTSPRPGLVFTDAETPDLRVSVTDAAGEVRVRWSAEEKEGPWREQGELKIPVRDGRGEAPLGLKFPGRGLFLLAVTARCGDAVAKAETAVAVVFTPPAPDPASPCGIFFTPPAVPHPLYPGREAEAAALSHRLLGAAWSRLNFWAFAFGKITIAQRDGKPYVTGDWAQWKQYAKALHAEGISISGEVAQCPGALSSKPDDHTERGDAGPMCERVKPRDYAEWDSLMENLARDFADEIEYWEIWNEANLRDTYWSGTPEELVELVHHTAAALRRGNPRAKIMGCGFVHDRAYADDVLKLGLGRDLDILSVHYTDDRPGDATAWRALLRQHGLDLPIWNTEEVSEVPTNNLAEGVVHSFKFMHIHVGYDPYRLLVNPDFTCRPPAVWYSVGAHFLAPARFLAQAELAGGRRVWHFERGDERVAVLRGGTLQTLFATRPAEVVFRAEPLRAGEPVTATNRMGRSTPVALRDGEGRVPLDSQVLFLAGARRIEVVSVVEPPAEGLCAEAEAGTCSAGWARNAHPGYSADRLLEIWSDAEPGPEGHWAEVKLTVPQAGRYEVLFSGNALSRLKPPRSLSPFTWRFDAGEEHVCDQATEMLIDVAGAPEGVSVLGQVELTAGEHTFRLRLTGRRHEPDHHFALWFDALALRPVEPER
ncbi:MAG: hypothetical protein HYU66_02970 [Armatimonadetes bacterium]|nr:hypothetical protein [Armatimonadota bacterium]